MVFIRRVFFSGPGGEFLSEESRCQVSILLWFNKSSLLSPYAIMTFFGNH